MKNKKVMFWCLTLLVLVGAITVSFVLKTDRIYTHFFYIPIALSAVIFPRYTGIFGVGLAGLHLVVEYYFRDNLELIAFLRSGIMVIVSYALHYMWHKERDYRVLIDNFDYHRYNDALTGAYNKRHFEELDIERLRYPVMLMTCELDNLNQIQIDYGKTIADGYAIKLAEILLRCIREDDQLIYMQEGEFLLLFEHCDKAKFHLIRARIDEAIASIPNQSKDASVFPMPMEITLADMPAHDAKGFHNAVALIKAQIRKSKQVTK
jgi:GGDEF domain-containing protein